MDKITASFAENLLDKNIIQKSDFVKIQYAISVVKSEALKTLLLILIFYFLNLLKPFFLLMVLLIPLRMSTGGIHVENSIICFSLSLFFNLLELLFLPALPLKEEIYQAILLGSALLICLLPLAPSQKRRIKTKQKYRRNKIAACSLCLFWVFMLQFVLRDAYFIHCGIWAFFLQAIQILLINAHNKFKRGLLYD